MNKNLANIAYFYHKKRLLMVKKHYIFHIYKLNTEPS